MATMRLTGFIYAVPPIDFWDGWSTLDEVVVKSVKEALLHNGAEDATDVMHHWADHVATAISEIKSCGKAESWREGPYLAGLPVGDCHSEMLVAMKAENNGNTYIWSPIELAWLEDSAFDKWRPTDVHARGLGILHGARKGEEAKV